MSTHTILVLKSSGVFGIFAHILQLFLSLLSKTHQKWPRLLYRAMFA